ncbi:SAM-dependent methyltransferase [uncultured Sphingomonas sp.]|uniref:SAM-dependent methyltransferase n=1 Tax=uncultured Sphingomonas sp. TaxID=158754 RepID=UPI0035C9AB29
MKYLPAAFLLALCAAPPLAAQSTAAPRPTTPKPLREPDVIYVPTPFAVVDAMLDLAQVKAGDVLYDLGSGDGRIPVTASARFGIRAVGVDINPTRIAEARVNAAEAKLTGRVTFRNEDLFETDIREATVVTLYLLPELNDKLRPRLMKMLKPGTRIVSHAFGMTDWVPEATREVEGTTIYLWRIPAR